MTVMRFTCMQVAVESEGRFIPVSKMAKEIGPLTSNAGSFCVQHHKQLFSELAKKLPLIYFRIIRTL